MILLTCYTYHLLLPPTSLKSLGCGWLSTAVHNVFQAGQGVGNPHSLRRCWHHSSVPFNYQDPPLMYWGYTERWYHWYLIMF